MKEGWTHDLLVRQAAIVCGLLTLFIEPHPLLTTSLVVVLVFKQPCLLVLVAFGHFHSFNMLSLFTLNTGIRNWNQGVRLYQLITP